MADSKSGSSASRGSQTRKVEDTASGTPRSCKVPRRTVDLSNPSAEDLNILSSNEIDAVMTAMLGMSSQEIHRLPKDLQSGLARRRKEVFENISLNLDYNTHRLVPFASRAEIGALSLFQVYKAYEKLQKIPMASIRLGQLTKAATAQAALDLGGTDPREALTLAFEQNSEVIEKRDEVLNALENNTYDDIVQTMYSSKDVRVVLRAQAALNLSVRNQRLAILHTVLESEECELEVFRLADQTDTSDRIIGIDVELNKRHKSIIKTALDQAFDEQRRTCSGLKGRVGMESDVNRLASYEEDIPDFLYMQFQFVLRNTST